ncbi:MAG: DUF6308 family protein [Actinomycetota bacterium]|nr:DUF6308 family protein [Actinomycetota bacterium]
MSDALTVGGRVVPYEQARDIVAEYVTPSDEAYAYPAYDGYRTNDDPDRLADGDLLAPTLLNVSISIRTYTDLHRRRDEIEAALASVPDIDLADATADQCAEIASVFSILDTEPRPHGALLTTMAKILHRKRPATIPLYDELVRSVYQPFRIAVDPDRSWQEFVRLFISEVRADLAAAPAAWTALAALTPSGGPPISRLRALDIVAWRAGRDGLGQ